MPMPNHTEWPSEIQQMVDLALDLHWSWNHSADDLWNTLDPDIWRLTQNPWAVLQTISPAVLKQALADTSFKQKIDDLLAKKRFEAETPTWFATKHSRSDLKCVAYFSMEYMLSEALPIYSGGLGNVAGDQLKAASDLGVPVVAVGLLYHRGYFRQSINADGWQQELYTYNDPSLLPIRPLRSESGEWVRIELKLPGFSLWLRGWEVQVGRCRLYLLDTNDPANPPAFRGVTSELYGGGPEQRLQQEMILGIGGWQLLNQVGIHPDVCHLNEGHAAFVVLERARSFMQQTGLPFHTALTATRVGNLFTTHTALPAGFDRFAPDLIRRYMSRYAATLQISVDDILSLGRANPHDAIEPLNMAYLAMRGCCAANGVSRLHGRISRRLFEPLFPRWPEVEVPIGHVTNGVHMPAWDSQQADALWTRACGPRRWLGDTEGHEALITSVPDEDIWLMRNASRNELITFVRETAARQMAIDGIPANFIQQTTSELRADVLTLGFARRFAEYKRPQLLFADQERLHRILTNTDRPVQLLIAGKAHPGDRRGHEIVQQWIRFIRDRQLSGRVVFLNDYDMIIAERLVQGVDVWLNLPRRPWEASGTSGMKVLVNGGLNLSELDGWWAEAYTPEVGWAIGDGSDHSNEPDLDCKEASDLYRLLETQVVPEFYSRDTAGLPRDWIRRIRASMAQLTSRFSANRCVRQYTEDYYLDVASAVHYRCANGGVAAIEMQRQLQLLRSHWHEIRFGNVAVHTADGRHWFRAEVVLTPLDPACVRVELFANALGKQSLPSRVAAAITERIGDVLVYQADVFADRNAGDFTFRIIPSIPGVRLALEEPCIVWQR